MSKLVVLFLPYCYGNISLKLGEVSAFFPSFTVNFHEGRNSFTKKFCERKIDLLSFNGKNAKLKAVANRNLHFSHPNDHLTRKFLLMMVLVLIFCVNSQFVNPDPSYYMVNPKKRVIFFL